MSSAWITEVGETGVVQLTQREGSWFVTDPPVDGETICMLQGDFDIPENDSTITREIAVAKFVSASGNGSNYLFAEPIDGQTNKQEETAESDSGDVATRSNTASSPSPCPLTDLNGSGEYVTAEAIIDEIFWVKKDERRVPDIAGAVRDVDSSKRQMFVVNDGVNHPYLEEGQKFRFKHAKDHYYENGDKVQLMITSQTEFTDKGLATDKTTSKSSGAKSSSGGSTSQSKSSPDKSLNQIAKSMLDEDLTVEQREESAVGKAKKKAKRQQRDPAIDPKLNDK